MKHYFLLLLLIGCIASGHAESGWKAHWINTERCQSETNTWLAYRQGSANSYRSHRCR